MKLQGLPDINPSAVIHDHSFVFDAHNYDPRQLITRYRGTAVAHTNLGTVVTGWQKSIYHFGGLNREVPILVTVLLDKTGQIRSLNIDPQSKGSQGKKCDFACLEKLCREKLKGISLADLGNRVSSAPDVKCLHLFEILSACSSFYVFLSAQGLQDGSEQELTVIRPKRNGLISDSIHEILGKRDRTHIRLEYRTPPTLNTENLADRLDAVASVRYNGEEVFTEELQATDFETVYARLNRLFSRCHHREKAFFGLKGRMKFFNTPSMVGLFLLAISHSHERGGVIRAWKIEIILHYLQTGYGKNPCKGFGG